MVSPTIMEWEESEEQQRWSHCPECGHKGFYDFPDKDYNMCCFCGYWKEK